MKLTIVGCHSASPRYDANPTAQILEVKGHLFLIDCGEGTQVQLRKFKIKFARNKTYFYFSPARRSFFWFGRSDYYF